MHALAAATLHRLTELHGNLKEVVIALPATALDWSPTPEVNSVAVLVAHVCGSERFWIGEKVGGLPAHRDRSAEFVVHSLDSAALLALLDDALALAGEVLADLSLDELATPAGVSSSGFAYDVAWALQHALEHVALHTGHVELMRQWWESQN
jgi:uncharacterized damage-inducible protein DinB